jgi:hypothetical protein
MTAIETPVGLLSVVGGRTARELKSAIEFLADAINRQQR